MMVVDASVVLKWFLPEAGSREAIALQTGPHNLIAPALIRMEVAGAICRATLGTTARITKSEAKTLQERWFALLEQKVLELIPDETLLKAACQISVSLGNPLVDCLYLALAQQWNIPLMTADRALRDRVLESFPKVRLLTGLDKR